MISHSELIVLKFHTGVGSNWWAGKISTVKYHLWNKFSKLPKITFGSDSLVISSSDINWADLQTCQVLWGSAPDYRFVKVPDFYLALDNTESWRSCTNLLCQQLTTIEHLKKNNTCRNRMFGENHNIGGYELFIRLQQTSELPAQQL